VQSWCNYPWVEGNLANRALRDVRAYSFRYLILAYCLVFCRVFGRTFGGACQKCVVGLVVTSRHAR
jgi:hypothetical protein